MIVESKTLLTLIYGCPVAETFSKSRLPLFNLKGKFSPEKQGFGHDTVFHLLICNLDSYPPHAQVRTRRDLSSLFRLKVNSVA
jgi:hypothetical protein